MLRRGTGLTAIVIGVVALVAAISGNRADPVGSRPVTFDRLRSADSDPANWLTYSGQYSGQRYSRLDAISRRTVRHLNVTWIYQLRTTDPVETTPLVVDGVMYVTRANDVIALDAVTGRPYWTYSHPIAPDVRLCCGRQNRGLAILGGRLFLATLDAQLVAIDAATGTPLWRTPMADPREGYSSTAAPLAIDNKIITGIAGGEFGTRGFIDAYDAATGARLWRFDTVPGPSHAGHESWAGDSWKTGGAPTWMTGSYDPDLNVVYWGVGNPGPDWNGARRGGDNLFSNSVIALDADRGTLRWYFQFTPHDDHDWDATEVPVLVDAVVDGQRRRLMYFANRNGFFYALDREHGAFLFAKPFARQTWAERIDEQGRPVLKPSIAPTQTGVVISPPASGATNWWPPTFSPQTGSFYVTAYDGSGTYFSGEPAFSQGEMYLGSGAADDVSGETGTSAVRAINPHTGARIWEYPLQPRSTSGLLATAGGLVFGGTIDGYMFALDAWTGADVWHRSIGGAVVAAPITYAVNQAQYMAAAAGDAIIVFALD